MCSPFLDDPQDDVVDSQNLSDIKLFNYTTKLG